MAVSEHQATVDVLAAEVRVLMVGSRQVTLSVYGQLDLVDDDLIEPFGRVRARADDSGYIYVVGRDRLDGSLVRARRPVGEQIWRHIYHLGPGGGQHETWRALCNIEQNFAEYGRYRYPDHKALVKQYPEFVEQIDGLATEMGSQAGEWANLPLIVLAGLR